MSFVVTRSSPPALVRPSTPTPAGDLPLTPTDKSRLFLSFTSFHVFEHPMTEPAPTIRRALSQALVYYYPVAGRVVTAGPGGGGDDVRIACTGEGVAFVSATATCTLRDVQFLDAPLAIPLADLALRDGGGGGGASDDPLLMMQVTEFACGGYVVAATWNHVRPSAVPAGRRRARARLPSPVVAPVRYDESLPDIPQLMSAAVQRRPPSHAAAAAAAGFESNHMGGYAYTDVTIPWSFIDRVKEEFRRSRHAAAGGEPCTTFEVVTAAVWQCRARAIDADPDAPAPLVFSANVRKHIWSKNNNGYYGNCLSSQLVEARAGAVVDLVRRIKDAKERIPESLTLRRSAAEQQPPELRLRGELVDALRGYSALFATCWRGIGMDAVDFGGGRPARVLATTDGPLGPSCFPCLPCTRKDGRGANVVALCVTEDHAHEFHAHLGKLR